VARVTQTHLPSDSPADSPADPDRTDSISMPTLFRQGHVLAGRYRIERFLDRGGMGEVYDASDLLLEERVALKVMREPCTPESPFLSRLRSEVQLARRVTHPNVCRIFDMGLDGETAFLTMELLDGETLAQRIKRGPLDPEEALPLVEQMAAALAAVHAAGIIHRDFKTANVFLVPHEGGVRAVVTDFGVARVGDPARRASNVTSTGVVLGTPAFMAPEQVEGKTPTPLIDVYALGVVMFNMLTADYPFDGESVYSVATKRVREDAPSPREFVPDLDPRWEEVILRCLEREPAARFPSVLEVPLGLRPEPDSMGMTDAYAPPRGDRRWFVGGMIAAVTVATVVGVLVARSDREPLSPAPAAAAPSEASIASPAPSIVIVEPVATPAPSPAPSPAAAAPAPEPELELIDEAPPAPRKKTRSVRPAPKAKTTASKPRTPSPPPVVDDDAPLPVP
jgi:eukaryotic-like serine/threonine-protein kinase